MKPRWQKYFITLASLIGIVTTPLMATEGQVVAWGANAWGLTNVPAGLTDVVAVTCGAANNFALRRNGTVVGWGRNAVGETNIPADLSNVIAVAASGYFANGYDGVMALKGDGTLVTWGSQAVATPPGLTGIIAIAAGPAHRLALQSAGTVLTWGGSNAPVDLSNVVAIAAGGAHSMALRNDGTVVSWGNNFIGQTNVPIGLTSVQAIAAGGAHSLALLSNGTVVAWGYNNHGQTNVPVGLSNVIAIAASSSEFGEHNLGLKSDGRAVQWGQTFGAPGGNFTETPPSFLSNAVSVAVGPSDSLAIVAGLKIQSLHRSNGVSAIQFHTFFGKNYSVEYATNLQVNGWSNWPAGNFQGDGFPRTVIHTNSVDSPQHYYRVRQFE